MLELFTTKISTFNDGSGEVYKNENKGIVYSISRVSIILYNTRYHYFQRKTTRLARHCSTLNYGIARLISDNRYTGSC